MGFHILTKGPRNPAATTPTQERAKTCSCTWEGLLVKKCAFPLYYP